MPNDSSTGGYLVPSSTAPLEDDALDDFFHDVIVGITGLTDSVVLPRWQPEPPLLPIGNWVAFGVIGRRSETFPNVTHTLPGDGTDVLTRNEDLDLLCSFYGLNCQAYGTLLRDGLSISQNREVLSLANMGLIAVGDLQRAPELVKNKWLPRADLQFSVRREIKRTYPVLHLLSANGTITPSEGLERAFTVEP